MQDKNIHFFICEKDELAHLRKQAKEMSLKLKVFMNGSEHSLVAAHPHKFKLEPQLEPVLLTKLWRITEDFEAQEEDENGQKVVQIEDHHLTAILATFVGLCLGYEFKEYTYCDCCTPREMIMFFEKRDGGKNNVY